MKKQLNNITRNALAVLMVTTASLSLVPVSVQAHHAFAAEFDGTKPIEINGVVTKVTLTNPHSWVYLEAKDSAGKVVNWGFEFGAPFALQQKSLTRNTLPIGTVVTLKGFLSKNGQAFAYSTHITLPDGRTIQTGGAPDAPAEPAKS